VAYSNVVPEKAIHVLALQLDAGVDERVVLMSRDEQSVLVVSYKELKNCAEAAFNELRRDAGR
jgi:PAB-dependent poly(A)-specific ribonuclease subunit 3